jgi:hypothetical protein
MMIMIPTVVLVMVLVIMMMIAMYVMLVIMLVLMMVVVIMVLIVNDNCDGVYTGDDSGYCGCDVRMMLMGAGDDAVDGDVGY